MANNASSYSIKKEILCILCLAGSKQKAPPRVCLCEAYSVYPFYSTLTISFSQYGINKKFKMIVEY